LLKQPAVPQFYESLLLLSDAWYANTGYMCLQLKVLLGLALSAILAVSPLRASPVISEFMADNKSTLWDENGDSSDWIEIFNPDATNVSLSGWYLTDDENDLTKWAFPAVTLKSGEFLVVFASKKDRSTAGAELHTNFKLAADGEYLALVMPDGTNVASAFAPEYPKQLEDVSYGPSFMAQTLLPSDATMAWHVPVATDSNNWQSAAFDDSAWSQDRQGFGFLSTPHEFKIRLIRSWYKPESIADAETILSDPSYQDSITTQR
jgi:hypothetical protein